MSPLYQTRIQFYMEPHIYETRAKEDLINYFNLSSEYNSKANRTFESADNLQSFRETGAALVQSGWNGLEESTH